MTGHGYTRRTFADKVSGDIIFSWGAAAPQTPRDSLCVHNKVKDFCRKAILLLCGLSVRYAHTSNTSQWYGAWQQAGEQGNYVASLFLAHCLAHIQYGDSVVFGCFQNYLCWYFGRFRLYFLYWNSWICNVACSEGSRNYLSKKWARKLQQPRRQKYFEIYIGNFKKISQLFLKLFKILYRDFQENFTTFFWNFI